MRLPWKVDRSGLAEARREKSGAERRLDEARRRWPEVHRLSKWARDRQRENHLTELFFDLRGRQP